MARKENKQYFYISLLVGFIVIGIGTIFHDPLLHSFIAFLYGWIPTGYSIGLTTGSTSFAVPADASMSSLWIYYMFPSMFIFIVSFLLLLYNPNRLIIIAGLLLMMLNFASILPNIIGSDSYNAVQALIKNGWTESSAYGLHYFIAFIMLLVLLLYLYIGIENNPKDARSRSSNIYR